MKLLRNTLVAGMLAATAIAAPVHAGGTLRLDEVAVGELDPSIASDYADSILMFNVYDTLVLPVQGGPGHAPHLATDWSSDGNTFTFNLRTDVKFQSGNPLTADDVVFSVDRMKAVGGKMASLFNIVESVEAVDADTVRFTLSSPYTPFVASLTRLPIVDKALVMANLAEGEGEMGDWGKAFLSANSAGSGAYTVASHNPQEVTVMEKNGDYFLDIADAAPDTVRLRYGLEAATVRTLIAQGEHDISSQWLPPEVKTALTNDGAQLLHETGTGAFYMKMNTTKAPLDDVNCRRALSAAFDYSTALKMIAITDDISGGSPSTGGIPKGMFGSNAASMAQTQDMAAAKEYLANCAHNPADIDIEISWIAEVPLEERFALLLQSNLTELGIKSHIVKMPWALFAEQVSKPENTPHISQLFVTARTGDPDTLLYGMYHSTRAGTWQSPEYLNDALVDQYLDEGRSAKTDAGRQEAYAKLNARLMEIAPSIYGYDRQNVFAASNRVSVPALTDPSKAFGLDGMGFTFRQMEMAD